MRFRHTPPLMRLSKEPRQALRRALPEGLRRASPQEARFREALTPPARVRARQAPSGTRPRTERGAIGIELKVSLQTEKMRAAGHRDAYWTVTRPD